MDSIHPIDSIVGRRLRLRRKELGLSQQQLANELGLTFQQVQKYERGSNRMSASKLWMASRALSIPVSYFFADFTGKDDAQKGAGEAVALTSTPEGERLAMAFTRLDEGLQRRIVDLIEAMQKAS